MSRSTDPSSVFDTLLEAAIALLLLAVIAWTIVWIVAHIWLWLLVGGAVVGGVILLVRYLRWRRQW